MKELDIGDKVRFRTRTLQGPADPYGTLHGEVVGIRSPRHGSCPAVLWVDFGVGNRSKVLESNLEIDPTQRRGAK